MLGFVGPFAFGAAICEDGEFGEAVPVRVPGPKLPCVCGDGFIGPVMFEPDMRGLLAPPLVCIPPFALIPVPGVAVGPPLRLGVAAPLGATLIGPPGAVDGATPFGVAIGEAVPGAEALPAVGAVWPKLVCVASKPRTAMVKTTLI